MARSALITGASRGIGSAIAERLARDGFDLALLGRDAARLQAVCERVQASGVAARALLCDVRRRDQVERALDAARTSFGVPDALINNAGLGGPYHRADEVSDEEWSELFETNVRGPFWFTRALLPEMKERGHGRIVNIASIEGHFGAARSSTYAATKHALIGYTRSIAAEWGPHGITCNAVSPGFIQVRPEPFPGQDALLQRIPARRLGLPADAAELVALLVSPAGGYINGASLIVDGGLGADLGVS